MRDLLNTAKHEIVALRRANEVLTAQMAVVEVFAAALGLKRNEGGMSPDVVHELQKEIERMDTPGAADPVYPEPVY